MNLIKNYFAGITRLPILEGEVSHVEIPRTRWRLFCYCLLFILLLFLLYYNCHIFFVIEVTVTYYDDLWSLTWRYKNCSQLISWHHHRRRLRHTSPLCCRPRGFLYFNLPIFSQCRPNFIPNSSQVFPEGLVASDGRLQPGDQIIEINGADMTCATHAQVFLFMLMLLLMVTKVLRSIAPIKHKRTPNGAWSKRHYPGDGLPTLRSCFSVANDWH